MAHLLLSPQVNPPPPVSQPPEHSWCSRSWGMDLGASVPACIFITWGLSVML